MNDRHVLITGANGYLGAALLQALSRQEFIGTLSALVRRAERFGGEGDARFPAAVRWLDWNDLLAGRLDLSRVDVVCHLAAGRDSAAPDEIADTLRLGAELFRQAVQHGVRGIINASSQAVYGVRPTPWSESDPPAPVSIHGMAKLASEILAEQLARSTSSTHVLSLRIAKLVGPSPMFRIAPDEAPHVLAREVLAGRNLVLRSEGRQQLDLMDVRDAVAVIVRLLEMPPQQWPRVMNVGSGRAVTLLEVARLVAGVAVRQGYVKSPRILLERQSHRMPRDFGLSCTRLQKTLAWTPGFSLTETIKDIFSLLIKSDDMSLAGSPIEPNGSRR